MMMMGVSPPRFSAWGATTRHIGCAGWSPLALGVAGNQSWQCTLSGTQGEPCTTPRTKAKSLVRGA
eukprot:3136695-Karenia_brevis.AAC.1